MKASSKNKVASKGVVPQSQNRSTKAGRFKVLQDRNSPYKGGINLVQQEVHIAMGR